LEVLERSTFVLSVHVLCLVAFNHFQFLIGLIPTVQAPLRQAYFSISPCRPLTSGWTPCNRGLWHFLLSSVVLAGRKIVREVPGEFMVPSGLDSP